MSVSLSPEAIQALNSLFAAATPVVTQPALLSSATLGMPPAMAAFWASDYPGKGIAVRQLANGRWVDAKGVFCKAPSAAVASKPAPKVEPKVAAPKPAATYTIAHFAEEHPEAMADLKAAILGTVFTQGGSWGEFRMAVLGR